MNFETFAEQFKEITEAAALGILSQKMPLDSLVELNEPIDKIMNSEDVESYTEGIKDNSIDKLEN